MFLLTKDFYEIKKTPKKGRGVFVKKDISAGTIIGDYLGKLVTDNEAELLEEKLGNACYSMNYRKNNLSIFPLNIKSIGVHLINHSCAPNCDLFVYYGHTLIFATRKIFPGEELAIDYSFNPGSINEKDFLYPCHCGSDFCRGTIYTSAAKLSKYYAFCQEQTKNQKFRALKAGEILTPLKNYPTIVRDNNIFPLFAYKNVTAANYNNDKLPTMSELRRVLRENGRVLNFKKLGLRVLAINDGSLIIEK